MGYQKFVPSASVHGDRKRATKEVDGTKREIASLTAALDAREQTGERRRSASAINYQKYMQNVSASGDCKRNMDYQMHMQDGNTNGD